MKGSRQSVYFATHNKGKFAEAVRVTARFGIRLKHLHFEKKEIQSNDLTKIASFAAKQASNAMQRCVVTEDAGFFVKALNGFPGPYSAYVLGTLGVRGVLTLLGERHDRSACFKAAVAYCEPRSKAVCFTGVVTGAVSRKPKGMHGFGFDPIFIPSKGYGQTFAEMSTDDKNTFSHRALAFQKFSQWFIARRMRS